MFNATLAIWVLMSWGWVMAAPEPLAPEGESVQSFALVELFTSQGCSSCPAADAYLSELTRRAEAKKLPLFTLSFHVDYWDYLGWRDPFADKAFTNRQRAYAGHLRESRVYTPQMVVNGEYVFVGSDRRTGEKILKKALSTSAQSKTEIHLDVEPGASALTVQFEVKTALRKPILNVAVVESHLSSQVKRGENRGRRLGHDHVVRSFVTTTMDRSGKGRVSLTLPEDLVAKNAKLIAYVQESGPGKIRAARMVSW